MKRAILLGLALTLAATACGGDDASDTSTTTTTQPTTTTTAPTTTTSTTTSSTTTTSTLDLSSINPNISRDSKVTTAGLGPVRIGMNPQEANIAAGYDLAVESLFDDTCYYLDAAPVLPGVAFMVNDGTIARVDITAGPVSTRSGARIGMTAQEIKNLFPGQIDEEPHAFTDGKYLIFVPKDEADKNFRVVWETDFNGTVVNYRAGRLPEVLFVEGCA